MISHKRSILFGIAALSLFSALLPAQDANIRPNDAKNADFHFYTTVLFMQKYLLGQ